MNRTEKVAMWIYRCFYACLALAAAISSYRGKMEILGLVIVASVVLTLVIILKKKSGITIPSEIEIAIILFIYASLFLGEILSFYHRFWWWDAFLHTLSGIIVGLFAFLLVYALNKNERAPLYLSPFFVALFSFSFALAIGVIWEIYEFSMDQIFGFNMQKSGLIDTMWDLMVATLGALIVSFSGYLYLKYGRENYVGSMIQRFIEKNKRSNN